MPPEIRRVHEDELPAYLESLSAAFLERPDVAKVAEEVKPIWDLERTWAAVDGGRICGSFRSWKTELTVPGGSHLPAAAVSAVTVKPTHRRRGILRAMVAAEHGAMRERGEAVSLLYASEYPIYGRFGYGPAVRTATWVLDATATSFHGEPPRGIELEAPNEAIRDAIKGVGEAWFSRTPGEIRRRDHTWDYDIGLRESAWDGRWKGLLAVRRDAAGTVDGFVRYRPTQTWERRQPRSTLEVDDLFALNAEAEAALWRYLAETDWVATVKAERRSPSERLPWLVTNGRAARPEDLGDATWVRLMDVPKALAARTYEREGSVVLEIVDPESAGGRQRLLLDAGPDGATCRATDRSPDLTLDVAAVGAAYLGGSPLRHAVIGVGGADEHAEGALAATDALFRTLDEPVCTTFF
jgi:predicted acetyltransferase